VVCCSKENNYKRVTTPLGRSCKYATSRILNVGAAAGESTVLLSAFGKVISVENDPYFVDHLLKRGVEAMKADITALPFPDNSFDLVCAFDVLEHVENDSLAMKELVRVCRYDGFICITVPMFKSLWGEHDVVNGHYRRYSRDEISTLIKSQQLRTVYISYFNTILFVPLLIFRRVLSFRRSKNVKETKSDFQWVRHNSFLARVLKCLFNLETYILPQKSLPFGVSLLSLSKKDINK
jgi:SAM-dependent methyltransferase